jgi:hypothetical protein
MAVIITRNSQQRCTNPRCPVAQVSNSRMVAPNIYNILTAVPDSPYKKNVYQFTCIKHKAPDNNVV